MQKKNKEKQLIKFSERARLLRKNLLKRKKRI